MRIQGLNPVLSETEVTGVNYSESVSVNDAYGYEAFINATFTTIAPLVIASTGWAFATDIITSVGHGITTGMVFQVSTSTTLPAGVSASTDYWAIYLTDDSFALASSLANAQAGTKLDFTDAGTGNHTLTIQTNVATFVVQSSPDETNWFTHDAMSAVSVVSAAQNKHFESAARFVRIAVTITKGAATLSGWVQSKG